MADLDVVIIGAGHNGLTCAAYLGMAGLSVRVVERRDVVGGTAVTEEFHPGFRNSVASYTVSLLQPKVIADLDLHRHGLRIVERRAQNFLPLPDGRYLLTGEGRTRPEIARFSARDAERYGEFSATLGEVADLLRDLVLHAPPNVSWRDLARSLPEMMKFGPIGKRVLQFDRKAQKALFDLYWKSAGDYLDGWFETDAVKALFGFDSIVGNLASPYTHGSAYVLLHHWFGEVNGKKGVWGHAIGGMGSITKAMTKSAREHGVQIGTGEQVQEIIVEQGRAAGVSLENGTQIRARAVVANVNPKFLLEELVPRGALPTYALNRMQRWKAGSGTFRMNVALSALPNFSALPSSNIDDHHTAGIILAPSLDYMDRAFRDVASHGFSREPIVEVLIPSTLDDSLAPPGAHVASLFCQHVSPDLPDEKRDEVADLMIATVDAYAPGFRDSVVGRQVLSPRDLARTFGLPNGDIFHGALSHDQVFSARPIWGHANHRMPLPGLYLCGSGAHPGGGVTGAPGHNAAAAIVADLRDRPR
jgi:phytoene dehydrogenase-like protein